MAVAHIYQARRYRVSTDDEQSGESAGKKTVRCSRRELSRQEDAQQMGSVVLARSAPVRKKVLH